MPQLNPSKEKQVACNICHGSVELFGSQVVLDRFDARYMRCSSCGFLQVEKPHWLDQAYSSAIADIDIGVIDRLVNNSRLTKLVLHLCNDPSGKFVDFGGGYGGFVRRMRDLGYDFRWHDKHCTNLFAKDHVADLNDRFTLATAFEVLEHFENPMSEIVSIASYADAIFASTTLIGQTPPPLKEWTYYAPETGQHIAFFTIASMECIAKRIGMHYYTDEQDFHLFSKKPVPALRFRLAMSRKGGRYLNPLFRRPSLLQSDFQAARAAVVSKASL